MSIGESAKACRDDRRNRGRPDQIITSKRTLLSPNALGAILTEESIAALSVPVVAGGANNQLATPADGERIHQRGILYAPDYVINAGGIINVSTEYLKDGDRLSSAAASSRSRSASNRSGGKAHRPAATPRQSPTLWRKRLIGRA